MTAWCTTDSHHSPRTVHCIVCGLPTLSVDRLMGAGPREPERRVEDLRLDGDLAGHGCGDQRFPVLLEEVDLLFEDSLGV